jgi:HlyD family secretion protein
MLVMVLIDSDSYRVEAYFEETKIPHVKPGASAEIHLMDGSPALQGTVSSIARGITDQDDPDGMFMSMAPIRILRANEHGVLRRRQLRSPPWVQAGLNVRITPESGRVADIRGRRKSATNGLMHATIDLVWRLLPCEEKRVQSAYDEFDRQRCNHHRRIVGCVRPELGEFIQ